MSEGRQKENGAVGAPVDRLLEGAADNERKIMLSAVIGSANVNRWTRLRAAYGCETEEEFAAVLLDIAEKHGGNKDKLITKHENERPDKENESQTKEQNSETPSDKKDHKHKRKKNPKPKRPDVALLREAAKNPDLLVPLEPNTVSLEVAKHPKKSKLDDGKKQEHDIRKAPELAVQKEVVKNEPAGETNKEDDEGETQRLAIKIKMCTACETRHLQDQCPLQKPRKEILDTINYKIWLEQYKEPYENFKYKMEEQEISDVNKFSFAHQSLPRVLRFAETDTPHGLGVFAAEDIEEFTQFGPLIGKAVKEMDIPEDCNMRDMFQISKDGVNVYFCTEDFSISNWVRYIRPAPTREAKNVLAVVRGDALYFTTIKKVNTGQELIYWQEDFVSNNKKKMEKNTCGGCNMTFSHHLYYRLHCSAFHDIRYSLTIRKYHCKVCGEAVLGKDNIMKHAVELHNGQGAYQCQFCKKFFLRLNYLEMHRTYGCSANPHRSRPLCDFCGRKFCQPQKLKIHIKRMHSDLSEVLKEFQCKNCMKILGSRAALQRHLKEVHQKQLDGACTCIKCGKLFQNKSNLKIHMLTHSGIKPFKCAESNCAAGFTTKQCLQFHYKKVHGFTEDMMPKIERSVDYTFEAYSGGDEPEIGIKNNGEDNNFSDQEDISMEDKSIEDSMQVDSPHSNSKDQSPPSPNNNNNPPPPVPETFSQNNPKILSKGSKKWIDDQQQLKEEIPLVENNNRKIDNLEIEEPKMNFPRHESSNASLLVEAALDSVCSDANIDIDVSTTPTDTLVNNLYTLSHGDTLGDVTYNHSESRDINLISPSVNDHISVTDDQNIGIDYSSFHQEDFSPATSPTRINFVRDYINANSPHNYENQGVKNVSPPRYDFGAAVNQESDDSNGIGAQNLSLHNTVKENIQLDLSIYKSHYGFDPINFIRKSKYEEQQDRTKGYVLEVQKGYEVGNLEGDLSEKDLEGMQQDGKHKDDVDLDLSMRADLRNKFELDLDLRKGYEIDDMRRTTYDSSLDDFRMKSYDLDSLELRNKTYENLMEDFRTDRSFEPLVLNPSELQGLDMSARGYHNYSNLNRYHHLYPEVDRPSVDLRMNYSPPPPPTYSHTDILRVVSLDLTPPGRHSVDLSLRSHQITNSRLLTDHSIQSARLGLDQSRLLSSDQSRLLSSDQSRLLSSEQSRLLSSEQSRLLTSDQSRLLGSEQSRLLTSDQSRLISSEQSRLLSTELSSSRHIGADGRIISDMSTRILSDHTTNRILSNDQLPTNRLLSTEQRILTDDSRLLPDQQRLLDQSRMMSEGRILTAPNNGSISPVPYTGYSVSPGTYHPTALAPPRTHTSSPNPPSYHHYTAYY